MKPSEVVRTVVDTLPDALFVSALGTATSALRLATDDGPHFTFGAAMGSAVPFALGVAETRPQDLVVAVVGDGELLMGAGCLWSLAALRPSNLIVVVLADGLYSITGGQQLSREPRFVEVARALGGVASHRATTPGDLVAALRSAEGGPVLIEAVVAEPGWPGPSPFVDPGRVRARFEDRLTVLDLDHRTIGDAHA